VHVLAVCVPSGDGVQRRAEIPESVSRSLVR
jgi:hypothetical protein